MRHDGELWQEFADNGEAIVGAGFAKAEFDNFAKLCGTAHVWVWRPTNNGVQVLLQKRAADKKTWANCWDISTAGHVNLGENPTATAVREAREEIDLRLDKNRLRFCAADRDMAAKYDEIYFVYTYELDENEQFKFNDGEVTELRWVDLADLKKFARDPAAANIVPHDAVYFAPIFRYLDRASEKLSRKEENNGGK